MIDAEQYIALLFDQTYSQLPLPPAPALWIAPDIDVDTLDQLPAVTWSLSGDGQNANGPGLWSFTLLINVFGDGMDQAKSAARIMDGIILSWGIDPWSSVLTVDGDRINISDVDTIDLPTRQASALIGARNLVQYTGIYSLALRG